jgi:hypothetical protein
MVSDPSARTEDINEGKKIDSGPPVIGLAKGGKIKKVIGKPIGKDDGLVPARRGEFMVKKSSANKYGSTKMQAVNQGTAKIVSRPAKQTTTRVATDRGKFGIKD